MTARNITYISALLVISTLSWGQKVRLKRANSLRGGVINGERFDRVIGNVLFTQQRVAIYCDSAHFFKSQNRVEAFGRIRIREGDSVNIVASELTYDGNTTIAHLRKNVIFKKKGKASLYTDFLDYSRNDKKAHYFKSGKLIQATDTLTSERGYYDMRTNIASFKKNVVGKGKNYQLTSDTIQYDTGSKIIFFRDSTNVTNMQGDVMVCKSGTYDTQEKKFSLNHGVTRTTSYILGGDSYFLDETEHTYKVRSNVSLTIIEDSITIHGEDGSYNKETGIAKVYGNPYLAKVDSKGDTLFMRADTLVSIEKKITNTPSSSTKLTSAKDAAPSKNGIDPPTEPDSTINILLAYNSVRIFKTDIQGIADSLAFSTQDSTIYFFNDPVLWSGKNQMTAESIHMVMSNSTISRIDLIKNPFVVSKDTLSNFNQMKGREMIAYFNKGTIDHVDVNGNGESLYFALDKKQKNGIKATILMGMNRIMCSNMKVLFKNDDVSDINFYINPDASFIPPFALTQKNTKLDGFVWREDDKPEKVDVVLPSKSKPIVKKIQLDQ